VGISKATIFRHLKENLAKKFVSWRSNALSLCRRETLIKPIAQAMPQYAMNCYVLPEGLFCDELQQFCAQFFWRDSEDKQIIMGYKVRRGYGL
jgi:hypothetical protein